MEFSEDQQTELKISLDYKELAIAVVAFANSEGGDIYVGVNDNGEAIGIDIGKTTIEDVAHRIAQRTDPKIHPIILIEEFEGKKVIRIIVEKSFRRPHFADHIAYIRSGKSCQKMSADEIEQLLKMNESSSYDSKIVNAANLNDLSMPEIEEFIKNMGKNYSPDNFLRSRNLAIEEGQGLYPTVAGLLLFGVFPQKHLPQAVVTLVDYGSKEQFSSGYRRIETISGSLMQQIQVLMEQISRAYPALEYLTEDGIDRRKAYPIPPGILREAVLNALVHRIYGNYGNKVIVKLYPEKIVISNPAELPETINTESLREYQFSQNPILARVMFEAGLVEEIGEGVDKLIDWTNSTGLQKEEIYEYKNSVLTTTLYLDKPELQLARNPEFNNRQQIMIKVLSDSHGYSSSELGKKLGASKDTILNDIAILKKYINIIEEGNGPSKRYRWLR